MAELAVGLTKSVVEGALTKAQAAIEEEGKLRKSAQRDLKFIAGEFQMMQSFLRVAKEERVKNLVVLTWVRQIREVAYDMEDCIEFVVHLDKKPDWWRRVLNSVTPPCIPTVALPLDQAVDEIEQLKAMVEDVSQRNARYSLISDTGFKPVLQQPVPAPAQPGTALGATAFNLPIAETYTAKMQQVDLSELITKKDDDLQVIAVWGNGGDHGATFLIRKAFSDQEICTTFACRAWVKLVHPFNPEELVRCLMAQFHANVCDEERVAMGVRVLRKMKAAEADLFTEFERQVTKNRYLVVLEDISNMAQWDSIRTFLPDTKNGSRIIVSTKQSEIARLCVGFSSGVQVAELMQFSAEHSVYAFLKESSQSVERLSVETNSASTSNKVTSAGVLFLEQSSQSVGHESTETNSASTSNKVTSAGILFSLRGAGCSSSSDEEISTSKKEAAIIWINNNTLDCRESEMKELRNYVAKTRFNSYQVCMSVWGIAGVGKSHLVRNLYYNRMQDGQQFEKYAWVTVAQPFNLRDFSWKLLLEIQSESPQARKTVLQNKMIGKNPIHVCCQLLKEHRCLVVVDDLQSKEEWNSIRDNLVSPSNSVIIVITTEESIASYCADDEELVFNVKGLQADAAVELFKTELQRKNKQNCSEHDDSWSWMVRELIPKCGGLPKVIVSIAGLLATKTVKQFETARAINERFIHQLEASPEFHDLRDLFGWMHTYFHTCPDYLKPCIFYITLFPQDTKDKSIRRRRLVRRWIAEGYARDSDDKSAEDNGEAFFSELLDLSMIQLPPQLATTTLGDTRMVFCQVNGFIREYIVSRRMEENLGFELRDSSALTTQRTGRHLTIRESWDRDQIVFESMDFSRLRSLTVLGIWKSFFISQSMRLLRVLDLEDASGITDNDVEQAVKLLRRLKFISLRNCPEITRLPHSIGDLRQLQTLDVRHTKIVTLPTGITKLQKLQYIRAGTTNPAEEPSTPACWPLACCRGNIGVGVPRGIVKVTALHTLGVVNIGASGGKAILDELKKLTQLRKLGISGINKKNSGKFFSAISDLVHLESLLVQLDNNSGDCLGGISLCLSNLQSLRLYGSLGKLPGEIDKLCKLTKIDLDVAVLNQSDIDILGNLAKLSILRLNVKQNKDVNLDFRVMVNGIEVDSYKKVTVLKITCSSRLVVVIGKAMKNLEHLMTCSSTSLELQFVVNQGEEQGLKKFSKLKKVELRGLKDDTLKTLLEEQLSTHPNKPARELTSCVAANASAK